MGLLFCTFLKSYCSAGIFVDVFQLKVMSFEEIDF